MSQTMSFAQRFATATGTTATATTTRYNGSDRLRTLPAFGVKVIYSRSLLAGRVTSTALRSLLAGMDAGTDADKVRDARALAGCLKAGTIVVDGGHTAALLALLEEYGKPAAEPRQRSR